MSKFKKVLLLVFISHIFPELHAAAAGSIETGIAAFRKGVYSDAYKIFEPHAKSEDDTGLLAQTYLWGISVGEKFTVPNESLTKYIESQSTVNEDMGLFALSLSLATTNAKEDQRKLLRSRNDGNIFANLLTSRYYAGDFPGVAAKIELARNFYESAVRLGYVANRESVLGAKSGAGDEGSLARGMEIAKPSHRLDEASAHAPQVVPNPMILAAALPISVGAPVVPSDGPLKPEKARSVLQIERVPMPEAAHEGDGVLHHGVEGHSEDARGGAGTKADEGPAKGGCCVIS